MVRIRRFNERKRMESQQLIDTAMKINSSEIGDYNQSDDLANMAGPTPVNLNADTQRGNSGAFVTSCNEDNNDFTYCPLTFKISNMGRDGQRFIKKPRLYNA